MCVFQFVSLSRHLSVRAIVLELWNEGQTDRSGMNELVSGGDSGEKEGETEKVCLALEGKGWCACRTVTSKSVLKQGFPSMHTHTHNEFLLTLLTQVRVCFTDGDVGLLQTVVSYARLCFICVTWSLCLSQHDFVVLHLKLLKSTADIFRIHYICNIPHSRMDEQHWRFERVACVP